MINDLNISKIDVNIYVLQYDGTLIRSSITSKGGGDADCFGLEVRLYINCGLATYSTWRDTGCGTVGAK